MTNLEFYKEEINEALRNHDMYPSICTVYKTHYETDGNHVTEMTLLDWLCEEHQILDKEEKEYLSNVIKPFRNKIKSIELKYWCRTQEEVCLMIHLGDSTVCFPPFEEGTMYKGMKLDKPYTLKELGL